MIPYEELCRALEAYAARARGEAPPIAVIADEPPPIDVSLDAPLESSPPTGEAALPEAHPAFGAEDDSTHVGGVPGAGMEPVYDDRSNELDIGDVLSDEDAEP